MITKDTNGHVVGGAMEMDVTFSDGNKYTANVIANDIYSDIAVLQISQNTSKPLKPLVLGNSFEVGVGDTVIAIGNPFGLSDTMTTGIVSGIDRSFEWGDYIDQVWSGKPQPNVVRNVVKREK